MDRNHRGREWGLGGRLVGVLAVLVSLLVAPARAQVVGAEVGEIELGIEQVGVGSAARSSGWMGVEISALNRTDEVKELVLRIESRDADGDRPSYQRVVASNPGATQSWWVYMRLPASAETQTTFDVRAYEAIESDSGAGGYATGRLLGTELLVLTPANLRGTSVISPRIVGAIGRPGGLQRYEKVSNGTGDQQRQTIHTPFGNERTVVAAIQPDGLPDRWMGLEPFDEIIWSQGQPQAVRAEQAEALREWIERGGHLIIVLPSRGREWVTPLNNELHPLLPAVVVDRQEGVDLEPYRLLLAGPTDEKSGLAPVRLPRRSTMHTFEPRADAEPGTAICVLNAPGVGGGECIVARRLIGAGAVTLVGIDVNDTMLAAQALPRADVFWNRVLGRRGWTPSRPEVEGAAPSKQEPFRADVQYVDDLIAGEIAAQGQAAKGVLLGFVVFAAYWVVAGPLVFAVLKRTGKTHHAWVSFAVSIALFTAAAWGGAAVIRPRTTAANHLTVLTHVYGQDVQRARSWMSVLIPEYGDVEVRVESPEGVRVGELKHNAIAPWEARGVSGGTAFPDARPYPVDSSRPDHLRVPARQTVKQFRVDWAGITNWGGMPRPTLDPSGRDIGIQIDSSAGTVGNRVRGYLVHDLPAALDDVVIIVNERQIDVGNAPPWIMWANASAFRLTEPWHPGEELSLELVTHSGSGGNQNKDASKLFQFVSDISPTRDANSFATESRPFSGNVVDRLMSLLLYPMLDPVDPRSAINTRQPIPLFRTEMHGLDITKWLTHPSVIVIGHVVQTEGTEGPIPMTVDGREIASAGRTVVVWVYPLPDDPPEVAEPSTDDLLMPTPDG